MRRLYGLVALAFLSLAGCTAPESLAFQLNERGNQAYFAGGYQEALELYRQAQALRPDYPELNINAGSALHKQQEYERAARELRRAFSTEDTRLRARAHFQLGNNFYRMGQMQEAIEEYQWALRFDPTDADAKHNLEFVLLQIGSRPEQQPLPGGSDDQSQPQGQPGANSEEGEQGQPRQGGQERPNREAAPPQQGQGRALQEELERVLRQALEEAEPDLSVEEAIRILDALRDRERIIQALWNRASSPGRPPPAERDW